MSSLRDFRIYYYGATNIMSLRDYKYTFFVLPIFYIPTGWFTHLLAPEELSVFCFRMHKYLVPTGLCACYYFFTNMSSLRDYAFLCCIRLQVIFQIFFSEQDAIDYTHLHTVLSVN